MANTTTFIPYRDRFDKKTTKPTATITRMTNASTKTKLTTNWSRNLISSSDDVHRTTVKSTNGNNALVILNATVVLPTVVNFISTTSEGLTDEQKKNQAKFAVAVATCFSIFLAGIIGYVTFLQCQKFRQYYILKQKKDKDDDEKPVLTQRMSVVGQGKKQVVIERRPSVATNGVTRKISQGNQPAGSDNNSLQGNKMRHLTSSGQSPESINIQPPSSNSHALFPTYPNHQAPIYPYFYPPRCFVDDAVVKYGKKSYLNDDNKFTSTDEGECSSSAKTDKVNYSVIPTEDEDEDHIRIPYGSFREAQMSLLTP